MKHDIKSMHQGVARNPLVRLAKPIDFSLLQGEHLAVVGPNGAGKSLLIDTLLGKYPLKEGSVSYDFSPSDTQTVYDNVKYITFRDSYGAADANTIISKDGMHMIRKMRRQWAICWVRRTMWRKRRAFCFIQYGIVAR
jgi:ABC-type Mn2+/Zn2+ transport system ATPase subunit